jgi:choline dehydrogenase
MTNFVIIGAGSAGCILANRLSADPSQRVTLLEAGGSDKHVFYRVPAGFFGLMKSGMGTWKYECVPQAGLGGRTMYFPRGKVLGGSSSINGEVFVRGNAGDFDDWAKTGATGWSYEECLPYFRKLERFSGADSPYRGKDGLIGVTPAPPIEQMSPIGKAWVKAAQQSGYPYNEDLNGASQEGFGRADANVADGVRQSTSSTYLEAARSRPNLHVISGAHATRIILKGTRATGVEYLRRGRREVVETDGEVIVAGGAVNSPQLLLLSGVGPSAHLEKHGIATLHELPGVGENLQDHFCVMIKQEMSRPYSALPYTQPLRSAFYLAQYALFKSGPVLSNGLELLAFVKTRPELEYPDVQYHFLNLMYEDHGRKVIQREGFMASANVSRPRSRGRVTLASRDPLQAPLIDPNYLADPEDLRTARDALRIARKLIAQSAFDEFRSAEYAPGADVQSDAALNAYIRANAMSIYHPVGTCRMGTDPMAVVDSQLRVHGVEGLSVVDASVIPSLVSGNTNAATMMVAERAADLINARV